MAKFRRKPSFFEAEQWFPGKAVEGVYLDDNLSPPRAYVWTAHKQPVYLAPGDWVVREPNGDGHYPIKPEIMPTLADQVE